MKRDLLVGLILGLTLGGCAGATFNYKYYGLAAKSYDGSLLGPTAQDDQPLSLCAPDEQRQGKCVCMFSEVFFQMKTDHLDCEQNLINCQQGVK